MTVHFPFQNTYAALPANFFARVAPTPVTSPRLIKLNRPLALQLGLDPDLLDSPEGAEILAGKQLPDGADPIAMVEQFGDRLYGLHVKDFVFDRAGRLHVTQAGDGAVASYAVARDSSLVPLGASAPDGQAALCGNVQVGRFVYGANAGSATLSSWRLTAGGAATLVAPVAASTSAGPIELAASRDGRFVYVLSALTGSVDAFAPQRDGSLVAVGTTTGLPLIDATGGPEGILAR